MRRSTVSKSSILSSFVVTFLASATLVPSSGFAGSETEVCQLGDGFTEVLTLSDVKFSFSERDNGYAILVTSDNPVRKEIIRKMVFELLKEKSLRTHEATDGYGLESH